MGIEPTRAPPPELENTRFRVMPTLKCDGSVNFCGMWGNVGMRSSLFGRDLRRGQLTRPAAPLRRGLALHFPALARQRLTVGMILYSARYALVQGMH
jgi:hypothetical protein